MMNDSKLEGTPKGNQHPHSLTLQTNVLSGFRANRDLIFQLKLIIDIIISTKWWRLSGHFPLRRPARRCFLKKIFKKF